MATVSQTIPNYTGGISEQPDFLKASGTVREAINVIPDVTFGMYKRNGAKRLEHSDASDMDLANGDLKWFNYYRNPEEGSFVGNINNTGAVSMWRCNSSTYQGSFTEGQKCTVNYQAGKEQEIKDYLKSGSDWDINKLSCLTINDTTFVSTSHINVGMKNDTATDYLNGGKYAYVELKKTENGRQYALDISKSDSSDKSYHTATSLSVEKAVVNPHQGSGGLRTPTLDSGSNDGQTQGHCPHIGSHVFYAGNVTADDGIGATGGNNNAGSTSSSVGDLTGKSDLIFRLTILGQQGPSNQSTTIDHKDDYTCTYTTKIDLLHGGRGWQNGNWFNVGLFGAIWTIRVTDSEEYVSPACNDNSLVRPSPTPFDSDTAATAASILGGLKTKIQAIDGNMKAEIIGNGIYIYRSDNSWDFNVKILEPDLMRVITKETNDASNLPTECKHNYKLKITNSQSAEDDYYLNFEATGGTDGSGKWVECAEPGIKTTINPATMPVIIQRTAANTFTVSQISWVTRTVGDAITNADPSFIGSAINKISYFRNRLVILSGNDVCLSRPNDLYNFWNETALASGPNDRVDIKTTSQFPASLTNCLETNAGLVLFSRNQQFLLGTDETALTPDTARTTSLSTYFNNKDLEPVSLGTTLGFVDNSGRTSRFMEMFNTGPTVEPTVIDHSKVVPRMLPKDLNLLDISRDNNIVFFGKSGTKTVWGYRYVVLGNQRIQSAWFKWEFNDGMRYFFISDDTFYFIDDSNYFQKINLSEDASDIRVTPSYSNTGWSICLDNWTTISGGTYNSTTNITTFNASWLSDLTDYTTQLVVFDNDSSASRAGVYAEATISSNTFTVPGDWSGKTIKVGYLYDMKIEFPKFYPVKSQGKGMVADVNAYLNLHRINLALGRIGTYSTILSRKGRADFEDQYESTDNDAYEADRIPYLLEKIKTIPIYDKNTNVTLTLKSTHPSPATLRSLTWEGDYNINYRRV